ASPPLSPSPPPPQPLRHIGAPLTRLLPSVLSQQSHALSDSQAPNRIGIRPLHDQLADLRRRRQQLEDADSPQIAGARAGLAPCRLPPRRRRIFILRVEV